MTTLATRNTDLIVDTIPGVTWLTRRVRFADDEAVTSFGHRLSNYKKKEQWAIADYLAECGRRGLAVVDFEDGSKDGGTLRYYKAVADFYYDDSHRTVNVSFTHYRECKEVSEGVVETALAWLRLAEKENLSIGDLRERFRKAENEDIPGPPARELDMADVERAGRLARGVKFTELSHESILILAKQDDLRELLNKAKAASLIEVAHASD